jgi:hypothetical protein
MESEECDAQGRRGVVLRDRTLQVRGEQRTEVLPCLLLIKDAEAFQRRLAVNYLSCG